VSEGPSQFIKILPSHLIEQIEEVNNDREINWSVVK